MPPAGSPTICRNRRIVWNHGDANGGSEGDDMKALLKYAGTAFAVLVLAAGGAEDARAGAIEAYCDEYARDVAREETGGRAFGSTVGGAAAGAILGAIIGGGRGAGRGALIGGGSGLVLGAIGESQSYEHIYEAVYDDCIDEQTARYDARDRSQTGYQGHAPQQAGYPGGAPEPWTDEWYEYCSAKYRSFDDETGYYLAFSGNYRFCE
jgi:uncharacterized protein YcfJ